MYFMQHIQNGLINNLINSLKNNICQYLIFVKTYFTPKNMINVKKSRTAIEIASLDKSDLFMRHNHVNEIRKLPVHDHVTHVVKIDILTGHEETGNLHFYLEDYFSLHIYRKTMHFFQNLYNLF